MYKKTLLCIFSLFIIVFVTACSGNKSSQSGDGTEGTKNSAKNDAQYKDTLTMALEAEPTTLDAQTTTGSPTKFVMRNVYETLVALNENYEPVPMLADSIDISDDGKTYTFHLREGVKFHNGEEMKAEDVVASMERWFSKYEIARTVMGENARFSAKDEYTVNLELEKPALGTLGVIATHKQFPAIMPKEIIEKAGDDEVDEFIGTGPFKFEEWKKGQRIVLTKFNDYTPSDLPSSGLSGAKEALVDKVNFEIVTDPSTRLSGLQTKEYDIGSSMDPNNYEQIKNDDTLKEYLYSIGKTIMIYNRKEGPFTNEKMRHAINAAIDAKEILEVSFGNSDLYSANPSYMSIDQKDWYSEAGIDQYNQADPKKAKKLLKEAGYNGKPIKLLTTRDDDYQYKAAVVVKEQLEKIGVQVDVETVDWATYSDGLRDPSRFDMVTFGITTVTSPSQLSTLGGDRPGYEADPKVTKMLEETERAASPADAKKIWDEIQAYVWEEYVPATYFGEFNNIAATTSNVEGFTALNGPIIWNTSVKK